MRQVGSCVGASPATTSGSACSSEAVTLPCRLVRVEPRAAATRIFIKKRGAISPPHRRAPHGNPGGGSTPPRREPRDKPDPAPRGRRQREGSRAAARGRSPRKPVPGVTSQRSSISVRNRRCRSHASAYPPPPPPPQPPPTHAPPPKNPPPAPPPPAKPPPPRPPPPRPATPRPPLWRSRG